MQQWTTFTLRALFIIGFLIVLPVMAMPNVASLLDQFLYGKPESSVPPVLKPETPPPPRGPARAEASQVTHEVPLTSDGDAFSNRAERPGFSGGSQPAPPSFQRAPDFLPRDEQAKPGENSKPPVDIGPLDQATALRIDAVRSRLEELGAEYVRLEMSEDGRTFHCLCDMLMGNGGSKTLPFEATRNDPVAAAEAVLANVEAWRNAERPPARTSISGPSGRSR